MNIISQYKNGTTSEDTRYIVQNVKQEYAQLKEQLKDIFHYISLERNEMAPGTFYSSYFCPAIRESYINCNAKKNSNNMDEVFNSLYDVYDYIHYYLSSEK